MEMLLRTQASPVPTHTMFGSDGAMAMAPMDWAGWSSKVGLQLIPPSVVFQTPPEAAPMKETIGSPGTPTTAEARFPGGPMCRHRRPLYRSEVTSWAAAGTEVERIRRKETAEIGSLKRRLGNTRFIAHLASVQCGKTRGAGDG
jgi:hypothetical protein